MKKLPVAALLCVISSTLSAQNLRIVNAASLSEGSVARASIVTIFGTKLANGVAAADDSLHPPTTLSGVSVTIGGKAAALFYVSPTQINAVVDPATPFGAEPVVVTSPAGSQTGTLTVAADAAPGLFSLTGSGARDGAILNAVTFLLGDFSTRTANAPTYLALFATGLTSTNVTATVGGVPVEVTWAGPTPCCAGLYQINIALSDALSGAGRVPVAITVNGKTSNTVEVVLLPAQEQSRKRNREVAALAYVPNTSLVLSTDQNDDVIRVIDLSTKSVTKVLTLPDRANPVGIAVDADGTLAAIAESGAGKLAIINLKTYSVTKEVETGPGASSVAITGARAIVVNRDNDTVTIVDLSGATAPKNVTVGRGPMSVAVDAAGAKAAVTNENDGTLSILDLAAGTVSKTIPLGPSIRPQGVAFVAPAVAFVTAPANGPDGLALLVDITTGEISQVHANPDLSGGSTGVAFYNGKVYVANQTGGSISVVPVTAAGAASGPIATVKVDLGARALAIDAKDKLLVVSNEGSGTLVLVDLETNKVVGRVQAVRSSDDDDQDDRSDRTRAANLPSVTSVSPQSAKAGATFTLTVAGVNLTGATKVTFDAPGNGKKDSSGDFTVKNIAVSSDGKQLTATVTIDASARPGARTVIVDTPNGQSVDKGSAVLTVLP
jgi:uncharacterized protein (TIGR03437 family)